jgi:hypothetical protein
VRAEQWLAEITRRGDEFRAARDEFQRAVGEQLAIEDSLTSTAAIPVVPIVLEPATEVDVESCPVAAVRRALNVALSTGWAVRLTRALAAVPRTGLLTTYALRARRHDERLWAAWWNGGFECAAYWGHAGIEILGGERMALLAPAVTPVELMSVAQIKGLATERGIKIPSKFKKAEIVEHVKTLGLISSIPPPKRRGVLDALEGIRLTG